MSKNVNRKLINLKSQVMTLLIVIAVLTAVAIGLPGIWLLRGQLDRQASELVNQGNQMLQALLDAQNNELSNLAILTAQRPTLIDLLEIRNSKSLAPYLETLRSSANLDLIAICNRQGEAVVHVGIPISDQVCDSNLLNKVYQSPSETDVLGWSLAFQPVLDNPDQLVVVGKAFNRDYLTQLSEQIKMEYILLFNDELLGGSLPDNQRALEMIVDQSMQPINDPNNSLAESYQLDGVRFYASQSKYGDTGLETIVLLPSTEIAVIQEQLTRIAVGGILVVIIVGSVLGLLLTQQISRPLERLRNSAIALRKGNLTSSVLTNTRLREIAEVTYALEDARIALQHSIEELRQEKAWGDYLLESVVEGIITIDSKDRVTFFSTGAERITQLKQEQVLRKSIDDVFILTDRESYFSQRIPLPGMKPEIVTILVNERPLTLAISGARLAPPEAGKANLALSIRDISNEEAMRGLLGDFLANVTHEFRTPLTALAVSIELLLDQLSKLSQEEIRELLVSNHLGVLSLQNLIDNLLEGASIEAGRFHVSPRPIDLDEVIREGVRIVLPLMEKKHHRLQLDLPTDLPLVRADPRRTSQVVVNLLSNAIKWGPQGSEIYLGATVVEDAIRITVADQGPGISSEHQQNLFSRFKNKKADNGRAEYGAGLGLSVVKAIVESQKGQVGVEDRKERGAVFWFTIPIVELYPGEEGDL